MLRACFQHLGQVERRRIHSPAGTTMRLNRLERPESWPAHVLSMLRGSMPLWSIQQYPDYPAFYSRLAAFVGIPQEQVVVGAGSEDLVRSLFMLCADPGDKVAVLWPSCAMFDVYARAFGARLVKVTPEPGKTIPVVELLEQLPRDLCLFILPNPGQPVESYYCPDDVEKIARYCRAIDCVLAVDEAYHGFGASTSIKHVGQYSNLVVLRSFSKAFGIAGLRVGFAVAGPTLRGALDAVRQSGEVASLSMHVADRLMAHWDDTVRVWVAGVCAARDGLRTRVTEDLGRPAYGHLANHVLVDCGSWTVAQRTADRLAAHGVHVKAGFEAPVDHHILVTCGGPDLMRQFFDRLRYALELPN